MGRDLAEKYTGDIRNACYALLRNENAGQDARVICAGYTKHRSGAHFIFYRRLPGGVIDIVQILNQNMDF